MTTPRPAFGVNTLCRYCRGTGRVVPQSRIDHGRGDQGPKCRACGGIGFTVPPPTTADENSTAAAAAIEPEQGRLRTYVLDVIRSYGPIAQWQIEQRTKLPGNTVRPRVWELMNAGTIRRVGKNTTPAGRQAWTYEVSE